MPYRVVPFVTGEIYHIYNRSIAKQPIFLGVRDYQRLTEAIRYYRYQNLPTRFSHFIRLTDDQKEQFVGRYITAHAPGLDILSYSIMPNHLHFLVKQNGDNAISSFMSNLQNSYSKYFNIKRGRTGSLFQSMFKAVRIENDEQLLHVSRYIHLNHVTAYIIDFESLANYPWTSFRVYMSDQDDNSFINTSVVLGHFKSKEAYKKFVFDQVDYQRRLGQIKHLILE